MDHLGAFSHGRCQLGIFEILGLNRLFHLELLHSVLWLDIKQGFQLRLVKELVELVDEDNTFLTRGKFYFIMLFHDSMHVAAGELECYLAYLKWDDLWGFASLNRQFLARIWLKRDIRPWKQGYTNKVSIRVVTTSASWSSYQRESSPWLTAMESTSSRAA